MASAGRANTSRGGSSRPISLDVRVEGSRALLSAFRDLSKDASNELRDAAVKISDELAQRVAAAGRAQGGQAAALASTVKAKRDRIPALTVGGNSPVTSDAVPAWRLLFGSEFGAKRQPPPNRQRSPWGYRAHGGQQGFWIFPTVQQAQPRIAGEWKAAAERIAHKWNSVRTLPPRGAP